MITKIIDNYINKKLCKVYKEYISMKYNFESRIVKVKDRYTVELKINDDFFKPVLAWLSDNGIYQIGRLDLQRKIIDRYIEEIVKEIDNDNSNT